MTNQDRGAYTPQPDAPLQFDARGPRGGRRPLPMTLIGSAGVLVVLLGALALHYQHGVRGAGDPARPVGEPIATIKTAPPTAVQPRDPAVGADVYGAKTPEAAKIPTFAPGPEAIQPRPAPRGLTVQVEGAGSKPTAIAQAAPAATVKTTTTTTVAAAPAKPVSGTAVVAKIAETPAAPAKSATAAKPITTVAKTAVATTVSAAPVTAAPIVKAAASKTASGSAVVQIGAFSSTALADKGWSDVSSAMAGDMAGKSKRIEALEKNGATLYRTSVTGFSSRAAADTFCSGLKAKGKICFVKQ